MIAAEPGKTVKFTLLSCDNLVRTGTNEPDSFWIAANSGYNRDFYRKLKAQDQEYIHQHVERSKDHVFFLGKDKNLERVYGQIERGEKVVIKEAGDDLDKYSEVYPIMIELLPKDDIMKFMQPHAIVTHLSSLPIWKEGVDEARRKFFIEGVKTLFIYIFGVDLTKYDTVITLTAELIQRNIYVIDPMGMLVFNSPTSFSKSIVLLQLNIDEQHFEIVGDMNPETKKVRREFTDMDPLIQQIQKLL